MSVAYRAGYKYQLAETYCGALHFSPPRVEHPWVTLDPDGTIIIREGYAWDGASGPTLDTAATIRGSLHHDSLYQLLSDGVLPMHYKSAADDELYLVCRADGMSFLRARLWRRAVGSFGGVALRRARPILYAP